ncbi:MAG: hypothetical protein EPN93_12395 [Spirochaetes bacterium]|nr:MAG: hypothetical protein EPN93_12395 [Spirochaetota bacterium]
MTHCDSCPIEEKIHTCCARFPLSGMRVPLALEDGRAVQACPELDAAGRCRTYRSRPPGCASFYCERCENADRRIGPPPKKE